MRLIDVDVAVQNTHKEIFWTESQRASMQNFLFHQPTIDPERLRPKGRWECEYDEQTGETDVTCSNCKDTRTINGCYVSTQGEPLYTEDAYCPNCGAKMEG